MSALKRETAVVKYLRSVNTEILQHLDRIETVGGRSSIFRVKIAVENESSEIFITLLQSRVEIAVPPVTLPKLPKKKKAKK